LLDRFVLRLNAKDMAIGAGGESRGRLTPLARLRMMLQTGSVTYKLPLNLLERVRGTLDYAELDEQAVDTVLGYVTATPYYSPRRDLTLARLAVGLARLNRDHTATTRHVTDAARLMGYLQETTRAEPSSISAPTLPVPLEGDPACQAGGARSGTQNEPILGPTATRDFPVQPASSPDKTLDVASGPYQEDSKAPEHEWAPLRLPVWRRAKSASTFGAIIGVKRAHDLHDLAIVSTVLEASKFQVVRRTQLAWSGIQVPPGRIIFSPGDLRSYVRAPTAEYLLLIVIDCTALRQSLWQEALIPYLKEAYEKHSAIGIIRVGAAHAASELCAERLMARNLLDPRVWAMLEDNTEPGRATPLAHGLDVALNTLRQALQHGRSAAQNATLIVLSDGRGNVPLESSRIGRLVGPVNDRGVTDALTVAETIRAIPHTQVIFLDPQSAYYTDFPVRLAAALGAKHELVARDPVIQ
jgi:magnesium chelatase subunit D